VRYVGGGRTDRPIWVYTMLPTLISLQLYHLSFSFNSSISVRSHNLFKPPPPRGDNKIDTRPLASPPSCLSARACTDS